MTASFTAVPGNSAAQTKQGVCAIIVAYTTPELHLHQISAR